MISGGELEAAYGVHERSPTLDDLRALLAGVTLDGRESRRDELSVIHTTECFLDIKPTNGVTKLALDLVKAPFTTLRHCAFLESVHNLPQLANGLPLLCLIAEVRRVGQCRPHHEVGSESLGRRVCQQFAQTLCIRRVGQDDGGGWELADSECREVGGEGDLRDSRGEISQVDRVVGGEGVVEEVIVGTGTGDGALKVKDLSSEAFSASGAVLWLVIITPRRPGPGSCQGDWSGEERVGDVDDLRHERTVRSCLDFSLVSPSSSASKRRSSTSLYFSVSSSSR